MGFDHSTLSTEGQRIGILAFFRIGSLTPFFSEVRKKVLFCSQMGIIIAFILNLTIFYYKNFKKHESS
jgi:hypothetical protein